MEAVFRGPSMDEMTSGQYSRRGPKLVSQDIWSI